MPPDLQERDQALLLDMALAAKDALGFAAGMSEAAFRASRLHQNAIIRSLELRWASLLNADLSWARLTSASLHETNLNGANLSGTDLSGTDGLTQAQINGIRCPSGNSPQNLPKGLTLPKPSDG